MLNKPEILPLRGFAELPFGCPMNKAKSLLGEPEEISELEDEIFGEHRILWHYQKHGLTLFFCESKEPELRQLECRFKGMMLFGTDISGISEKEFVALIKSNNQMIDEREKLPWGETCMTCSALGIEAYFGKGRLQALSFFPVSA